MAEIDPNDTAAIFDTLYDEAPAEDIAALYNTWAETYDRDLESVGYAAPKRCAEALAACDPARTGPVADVGCGTGLSGVALRAAGFDVIDGFDISADMVGQAEARGCYRAVTVEDMGQSGGLADRGYAHVALVGVLAPDHAPATLIDAALTWVPVGGCIVFTFNDKVRKIAAFIETVERAVADGRAEIAFHAYGPHLPERGVGADVYVLRRL